MNQKKSTATISRREFALRAAMASATTLVPAGVFTGVPTAPAQTPAADLPKLSPQSQAEVEARYQAILAQYGTRFSDAQKIDLRRLCHSAQPGLDKLRAYLVQNGDGSALYLKPLIEREKKPATAPAAATKSNSASPHGEDTKKD